MFLSYTDFELFSDIFLGLLGFTNERYGLFRNFGYPKMLMNAEPKEIDALMAKVFADKSIIDAYIKARPAMSKLKVKILKSWKQGVEGEFLLLHQYSDYAVFIDAANNCLWGITGVSRPVAAMFDEIPVYVKTRLLPFKDKIVYDTNLKSRDIEFGRSMKKNLEKDFEKMKKQGIRTGYSFAAGDFITTSWDDVDDEEVLIEDDEEDENSIFDNDSIWKDPDDYDDDDDYGPEDLNKDILNRKLGILLAPRVVEKLEEYDASASGVPENEKQARRLAILTAENKKKSERFDGLDPLAVFAMTDSEMGENGVGIKAGKAGENCPIVKMTRFFLQTLASEKKITLTQAGYLPPRLVREIYDQGFIRDFMIEKKPPKIYKESEIYSIEAMRICAEEAGLAERSGKTLRITAAGREALEKDALFTPVFTAYCVKYNWAYTDRYDWAFYSEEIAQFGYVFSLYLFAKYGRDEKEQDFYVDKYRRAFFPEAAEENEHLAFFFNSAYTRRFFRNFLFYFGFAVFVGADRFFRGEVKASPLFYECLEIAPEKAEALLPKFDIAPIEQDERLADLPPPPPKKDNLLYFPHERYKQND